jgi:hypothetical protein
MFQTPIFLFLFPCIRLFPLGHRTTPLYQHVVLLTALNNEASVHVSPGALTHLTTSEICHAVVRTFRGLAFTVSTTVVRRGHGGHEVG